MTNDLDSLAKVWTKHAPTATEMRAVLSVWALGQSDYLLRCKSGDYLLDIFVYERCVEVHRTHRTLGGSESDHYPDEDIVKVFDTGSITESAEICDRVLEDWLRS